MRLECNWPVIRRFVRRQALVLFFIVLAGIFMLGWWGSTKYSERHLIRFGTFTLDTFSANSLCRISFVRGDIVVYGRETRYRQPNPRGKFRFSPVKPTFIRRNADIFEITLGYWHLVAGSLALAAICLAACNIRRA